MNWNQLATMTWNELGTLTWDEWGGSDPILGINPTLVPRTWLGLGMGLD